MDSTRELTAKIFDLKNGFRKLDNVKFVRILESNHNLLIMKDYLPAFGCIDGYIGINTTTDVIEYRDIKGYYIYRDNVFNLMIN